MGASSEHEESEELRGLTQGEVAIVRQTIELRYPGVSVDVCEVGEDFRSHRARPLYVVTSSVAFRVHNLSSLIGWRVAECARRMSDAVASVLASGSIAYAHSPDTPLFKLCSELEYGLVPQLLEPANEAGVVDIWFDGFLPDEVTLLASGIVMAGEKCWPGLRSNVSIERSGPFEAEISIDDGLLTRFELRCGDSKALNETRMLLRSQRFDVEGYDVIVRAEPALGEWPLEISLR